MEGDSDRFGVFVLTAAALQGEVRVGVEAYGYEAWVATYPELPQQEIRVLLHRAPVQLDPLVIGVGRQTGNPISLPSHAFVVDTAMMRMLPTVLETDALRAVAMSPSASAPSDWTAIPYVRGGTGAGTPVMLDGVRLFNPHHLGGFLSALNAETVGHVTLFPGAGGAAQRFGSLSGAIDVRTRDGARDRRRVSGSLGLASTRIAVEGPIGESGSFIVDGRRTYMDFIFTGLRSLGATDATIPYSFDDLHGKFTKDFGGVRRLSLTGYVNSEAFSNLGEQENETAAFDWGNIAVAAHYRDRLGTATLVDATIGHSRFSSDVLGLGGGSTLYTRVDGTYLPPSDTVVLGTGIMSENRADVRLTSYTSLGEVTVGLQATGFRADHDYAVDADHGHLPQLILSSLVARASQWRLSMYSDISTVLSRSLSSRAGLRVDRFGGLATTLAPFAEISYAGPWWRADVTAARSYQALASMRDEEAVGSSFIAYDLLAPVGHGPVPRNTEVSLGWQAGRGTFWIRLDAYARQLDNIRLPILGTNPLGGYTLGDPARREVASGTARGVEASWSGSWRSMTSVGGYRWSRVTRTVAGHTFVPRFHREHEFDLGVALKHGRSSWSARVSAKSGQPATPILAVLPFLHYRSPESLAGFFARRDVLAFGGTHNSSRLPPYARLDVGWRYAGRVSWFGGGSLAPFVSIANVFSLPNVVAAVADPNYDFIVWSDRRGYIEQEYFPQMPMVPFIGLEFRF